MQDQNVGTEALALRQLLGEGGGRQTRSARLHRPETILSPTRDGQDLW